MIKGVISALLCCCLLIVATPLFAAVSDDVVVAMVQSAADKIVQNAKGTLAAINNGDEAYINPEDTGVYVFVYDSDINMVAHIRPDLVGKNFKGKADPAGKMFRDDIVSEAIAKGKTWVDYMYKKPTGDKLLQKTTYAVSVKGSDGKTYVVCAGKYKE